jgi:hypothetical protein
MRRGYVDEVEVRASIHMYLALSTVVPILMEADCRHKITRMRLNVQALSIGSLGFLESFSTSYPDLPLPLYLRLE